MIQLHRSLIMHVALFLAVLNSSIMNIVGLTNPSIPAFDSKVPISTTDGSSSSGQLHWNDLGKTLLKLRDGSVPENILMMTRLTINNLSRVCVGSSVIPNAGRGVFAAMDCQKGDLLTCYPGDVLLQKSGMTGLPEELKSDDQKLQSLLAGYCIGVTDDYAIMGLPELDKDVSYIGHLINDGAEIPVRESELDKYHFQSNQMANAQHVPLENLHMVTIATRDIQKGEEIFVYYGPIYWMDHVSTWLGADRGENGEVKP